MYIAKEAEARVAELFGLHGVHVGYHALRDEEGKIIQETKVNSIWIAEFYQAWINGVVSIMHTHNGLTYGVFFPFPIETDWKTNLIRIATNKPVEMKNWQDPVFESISSINIPGWVSPVREEGEYTYDIMLHKSGFSFGISVLSPPEDESLAQLWRAILDSAKAVAKQGHLIAATTILNKVPEHIEL